MGPEYSNCLLFHDHSCRPLIISFLFLLSRLYEHYCTLQFSSTSKHYNSMLPYFPDAPISGHFDFTILHFVVKRKQIRTILSKDLSTSPLSFVLFAVELRFV